jgi:pyrroloquinoline quinone biosynthesis protein D
VNAAAPHAQSRPKLPRGVRLKHDAVRGEWLLLAPERVVKANAIAVAVLERCDGARTLEDIVEELCKAYNAPRETIERDVTKLIGDLATKRMVDL